MKAYEIVTREPHKRLFRVESVKDAGPAQVISAVGIPSLLDELSDGAQCEQIDYCRLDAKGNVWEVTATYRLPLPQEWVI